MDNSAKRRKMCYDKRRYRSERAAIQACIKTSAYIGMMRPYKCPYCTGWHLTHSRAE